MSGVSNYSVDKPSYAFSNATTEFDDALIRRGVLTLEQTIVAKGASSSEAQRLAAQAHTTKPSDQEERCADDGSASDSEDDFDDDDFLEQYRAQRLAEIKEQHGAKARASTGFGQVIPISRPEWKHHVNDASQDAWVVVTLTSQNVEVTGPIKEAATVLATQCPSIKFVTIPSTSAIDHWPDSNLPSLFVYRGGKMTKELVKMKHSWSPLQLLEELASTAGVEFKAEEIQNVKAYDSKLQEDRYDSLRRHMALDDDDEEDGDEVE